MFTKLLLQKYIKERAQAIVEFAIVLPILLMILVGILEVGRLIFIYAAVNNASREAVRYASAVGLNDSGTSAKFNDCTGIKGMATRSAFFVPLTITISHDIGPSTTSTNYCGGSMTADNISISSGDRVNVSVVAHYSPMVNLVPISERDFTSISSRTILGILQLAELPGGTASGCTGCGGGSPYTPSATNTSAPGAPSQTPTATATATATETSTPGVFMTFTPGASPTITLLPSSTATFTPTFTPTSTFTPTATSTPVPGCSNIMAGPLSYNTVASKTMSMTITNPHEMLTVLDVHVTWNALTGAPASKPLALKSASLGGTFWTSNPANTSGNLTIPTSGTVTIPGNNLTSTIIFTFDAVYQNTSGSSITITLSTPGCESTIITKP